MSTDSWPNLRRRVRALDDRDLEEAERLERLGRRRTNTLKALKAERQRRAGNEEKMLRLRVEVRR